MFDADTDEKSAGGVNYSSNVNNLASYFLGIKYVNGANRRMCQACRNKWEVFVADRDRLKNAFLNDEIELIQDADWG
jgi:hypothetical protein